MYKLSHKSEKIYYRVQHNIPGGGWETLPYGKDFAKINDAIDFLKIIERQEYFINYRILQVEESVAMTFENNDSEEVDRNSQKEKESKRSSLFNGSSNMFRYNSSTQLLKA